MKKTALVLTALIISLFTTAQPASLKTGDRFPAHVIRHIINAPVTSVAVQQYDQKILILNFWGTWCTPCLPEMDSLAVVQKNNNRYIQVVGISNESVARLRKYLQRKPSTLWLASDTAGYLYKRFALSSVGQCAIIDKKHRVIAITSTDSVNQAFIDRLIKGMPVASHAETGKRFLEANEDPFGVDTNTLYSLSLKPYLHNTVSMGKKYSNTSFAKRRISFINVCPVMLYKEAYDINSEKQVVYEQLTRDGICNYKDTTMLYCFDLLVKPAQKDSLLPIMQTTLNNLLPVHARTVKKMMPVYVLTQKANAIAHVAVSTSAASTYGFSGQGFDGTAIPLKTFVDYLTNELDLPVYDETGLTGRYDIKTENALRTKEDIVKALDGLGLQIEKSERMIDVLIIFR